jgi:transposase-like protein
MAELEKENRELRRANEILKSAEVAVRRSGNAGIVNRMLGA